MGPPPSWGPDLTFVRHRRSQGDGLKASFSIKRFDFGIEYAGRADNLIRDEVAITLDLSAG